MGTSARLRGFAFLFLLVLSPVASLHAQERDTALSDAEVEKIREAAPLFEERVQIFSGILDERIKAMLALTNGRKKPGRDEDIHDLMEQFTSIADDLEDNLDDYRRRHRDVRKVLPKVLAATERWQSGLKTPPESQAYEVSRKLALEAVSDLHDDLAKLIDEQKTYFLEHPPGKEPAKGSER
jgi:hypothetical protein